MARPIQALISLLPSFEGYLESLALKPATIRNYLADARAFMRWLEGRGDAPPAPAISDFITYRDHLAGSEHSQATVNRKLHTLRLYGRYLWEQRLLAQNPAEALTLMPNRNGDEAIPRVLDDDEAEALRAAVMRAARPSLRRRDLAIVQVMLEAGLRVAEVGQLRMDDLIITRDGLRLAVGEDGHTRQVPVSGRLAAALRDYMGARPESPDRPFLFVSQQDKPLCARAIQRLIETYARAAGLKQVNANALRHTCACRWLNEKHDPAQVAQWLGKRQPESLQKYQPWLAR